MTSTSIPPTLLSTLRESTRQVLRNLIDHQAETSDLTSLPTSRLAAVLVLLYEHDDGTVRVLLTTRSKHLRSHAGETALPGGRMDATDLTLVHTAYREAYEEVALPLDSPHLHTLCCLRPFLSLKRLWVTPVVAFIDHPPLLSDLTPSPDEVDCMFTHPLEAFLDPTLARTEPLVEVGSELWPYEDELHNICDLSVTFLNDTTYRMHRFRSSASVIYGLTADIMISVAAAAYGRPPVYERYCAGQLFGFAPLWDALQIVETREALA